MNEIKKDEPEDQRKILEGFMKIAEEGTDHAVKALEAMLETKVEISIPTIKVEKLEQAIDG